MKKLDTHTDETFVAANGKTVRYQGIIDGIAANVFTYANNGGKGMSREDTEDLFQDAAYKAVRSHGTYNPDLSSPKTFGSRIADNCERDAYTKAMRRNTIFVPFEYRDEDGEDYIPAHIAGYRGDEYEADRELRTAEAFEHIECAMARLNENYRYILGLHLEGLKPKKMAQVIGCTPSAAATLLCRARKALARELGWSFLKEHGIGA